MKEVVTLQFGNYANFVGAHFWNIQDELLGRAETVSDQSTTENCTPDELDSDALFRVGETHQGVATYTPRLVAFDLRGSSGTLPPQGTLYTAPPLTVDESIIQTWGGQKTVHQSEPLERNTFLKSLDEEEEEREQDGSGMEIDGEDEKREADLARVAGLEESVQYWTDYLKLHLHPKSVYELPDTWHGMRELTTYGDGVAAMQREETREEMEERVRFFAEESDHMQGFQCIADDSDGFAAVAANLLTHLSDEFPRLPRVLFAVRPSTAPPAASAFNAAASAAHPATRALHEAVSLAALSEASDLYISGGARLSPALFPPLALQTSKPFHTSAVHAAAFDSFTTPYRLTRGASPFAEQLGARDMRDLVRLLSKTDRTKVSEISLAFPAGGVSKMQSDDARVGGRRATPGQGLEGLVRVLVGLSEGGDAHSSGAAFAESLVFRGARYTDGSGPASPPAVEAALHASLHASNSGRAVRHLSIARTPLPIPLPFPNLFRPVVGRYGDVSTAQGHVSTAQGHVSTAEGRVSTTEGDVSTSDGDVSGAAETSAKGGVDVESAPVMSRLAVTPRLASMLRSKLEGLERFGGFRKSTDGARIMDAWGFGEEEAAALREGLRDMVKAYEGGADEGSFESD